MKLCGSHYYLIGELTLLLFLVIYPDGSHGKRTKRCRYSRTRGPCDPSTQIQLVTFSLVHGPANRCQPTKVKSRPCDPQAPAETPDCRYLHRGQRGQCDLNTGMRSVIVGLKSGDSSCTKTKTLSKPCKSRKIQKKRKKKEACKYFRKGVKGPCDLKTRTRSVVVKLRHGNSSCAPTKSIIKLCKPRGRKRKRNKRKRRQKKCRYNRRDSVWSECDSQTNKKVKVMRLTYPNQRCPPTKTKTRSCGRKRKKRVNDCVYVRQSWSPCDERTNIRQREMVLTSGDPTVCLPKKVVTKKCKKDCRYIRGNWTECDPETNLKNQTWEPVPGSPSDCVSTVHTKLCSPRAEMTAAKPHKCKYLFSEWSSCDSRSNTMTQMMTLKNGDPNVCQRSVKLTKKCRRACKFRRGEWSICDKQTGLTVRIDTLIKGSLEQCDATRQITKKCRKKACKYSLSAWSECDPDTNQRSRVKKLLRGNKAECKAEEIISKSCIKRDGKARCFFGSYGDYGPCNNGVMTKHRPVLQGGVECHRKAVITKACGSS